MLVQSDPRVTSPCFRPGARASSTGRSKSYGKTALRSAACGFSSLLGKPRWRPRKRKAHVVVHPVTVTSLRLLVGLPIPLRILSTLAGHRWRIFSFYADDYFSPLLISRRSALPRRLESRTFVIQRLCQAILPCGTRWCMLRPLHTLQKVPEDTLTASVRL